MYQSPYDPFGYQSYNDPQPDHYTSSVAGMPYPAPPPSLERYPSAEHPHGTFQDQYYSSGNSYEPQTYGSQPYGSQQNHYPVNLILSSSQPEQYPLPYPSLSHSSLSHYPPRAPTTPSLYPSLSSAPYRPQNVAPPSDAYPSPGPPYASASSFTENSWPSSYGPKPNSTVPVPAPTLNFDTEQPNPYLKVPLSANVHLKPPFVNHLESHEGSGKHAPPMVFTTTKVERQDTGGQGPEQEKGKSNELQELASHALPNREDKKENVRFTAEEAHLIMKQLKETIKNLNLQLTNSRESTVKLLQERDALKESLEQLRKETGDLKAQSSALPPAVDHTEALAVAEREWTQKLSLQEQEKEELLAQTAKHTETIANKESEWMQKLSTKEQEKQELLARSEEHANAIAELERAWAEKFSSKERENSVLLARVTKLQSDSDDGRAFLLETNAAQEAELLKLREETAQLLDETTQLVDERDQAQTAMERLEGEKQELEDLLNQWKGSAAEFMEHEKATALEHQKLTETVAVLEKELEECRDLCEQRRLRIEELEIGELPSVKSDLELETTLHRKTQESVAELEDKLDAAREELEVCKRARDNLEQQLFETEKREMESNLLVAGETRSAKEELETLRSQLDSHLSAKGETEKWASELESEKTTLKGRLTQLEGEDRQLMDRISKLEKSLEDVTAERDNFQDEVGLLQETLEREAQDAEEAGNSYRLRLEGLEAQISTLTSAKSALETRAALLETEKQEVERLLHAAEELCQAVKEESDSLRAEMDSHVAAATGDRELEAEKVLLQEKLADLQDKNEQMTEQMSELKNDLNRVTLERDAQVKQVQALEEEKSKLESKVAAIDAILLRNQDELLITEAEYNKLWNERQDQESELSDCMIEMGRLKGEIANVTRAKEEALIHIKDLKEIRAELEAKNAAANVNASTLGTQICQLETDMKNLHDRYSAMSLQYAEVQDERDRLVLSIRSLRKK